jgi:hypothetical protein
MFTHLNECRLSLLIKVILGEISIEGKELLSQLFVCARSIRGRALIFNDMMK